MAATPDPVIKQPDGSLYHGAMGDLPAGPRIAWKALGEDRILFVEMDGAGRLLHEAIIPRHWGRAMAFVFGPEPNMPDAEEDSDGSNS